MLALFEPLGLLNLPLELRTLALTVVLVPLMVFILVPGLTWIALAAQATFGPHGHRPHDPGRPEGDFRIRTVSVPQADRLRRPLEQQARRARRSTTDRLRGRPYRPRCSATTC